MLFKFFNSICSNYWIKSIIRCLIDNYDCYYCKCNHNKSIDYHGSLNVSGADAINVTTKNTNNNISTIIVPLLL